MRTDCGGGVEREAATPPPQLGARGHRAPGAAVAAGGVPALATLPGMTTIIRAEAAHDFLALVPALVGYRPSRSLLCVAFDGNRTAGVLRHDLPRGGPAREALVGSVVGTLCRMIQADAVVPVVYTDARFADGGLPERELLAGIVDRAEEAGFLVRDALCVASDGWGSLLDDELPASGRELGLIADSPLARHPDALRAPADSATELVRIPPADPAVAARIAEVLGSLRAVGADDGDDVEADRVPSARSAPAQDALLALDAAIGDALDPFVAAELLAQGGAETTTSEMLAWFVHLAACPPFRDAMMLQVAFGPVIGELALECADEASERGARPPASDPTDPESAEEFLSRLLLGHAAARPDIGRVERALDSIVVAIANAPDPDRAGALCVAGWLAWALGRSSSAGALVGLALEADPEHSMAGLLHRFIGSGALPEWAFSPAIPRRRHAADDAEGPGRGGRGR